MKAKVIQANSYKYSIVKMCKKLGIPRSLYYYYINLKSKELKERNEEAVISLINILIFIIKILYESNERIRK